MADISNYVFTEIGISFANELKIQGYTNFKHSRSSDPYNVSIQILFAGYSLWQKRAFHELKRWPHSKKVVLKNVNSANIENIWYIG